jgi:hypothetical protein
MYIPDEGLFSTVVKVDLYLCPAMKETPRRRIKITSSLNALSYAGLRVVVVVGGGGLLRPSPPLSQQASEDKYLRTT